MNETSIQNRNAPCNEEEEKTCVPDLLVVVVVVVVVETISWFDLYC
jgi:hypothetical protein